MSDDLKCNEFVEILRKDFGALWGCRTRGNSIEIVTPFSTATQKFISVFITVRDGAFIVSDGGWLVGELGLYDIPDCEDESESSPTLDFFARKFGISTFQDRAGSKFFYKRCREMSLVSSAVYDLCNFSSSLVNTLAVPKVEKQEIQHKETFRGHANKFIAGIRPNAKFRLPLEGLKTVSFNAVIEHTSTMSLVMYVTGSRETYFSTDLKRAIMNFQLVEKNKFAPLIKSRVALINNEAEGYSASRNEELMPFLNERSVLAVSWTERESLVQVL